ncbi:cytochrome c oxidase subunit II [Candidatus Anaplasma sp. TIGMIC]|uniref:cytochrome c oxidase subunit II n=1 Tax=Candidatus Anaplasma sp. TIGMIC TaxID=3020713 RepID=UPI00232FC4FC|nr:cytochrome c oxidase subunit II [Candidatus Anaplasma sp. TIGMIC]MDB1135521.1 cytochrome c oxidase subunit II [Candidatus Anaplasma sp. TIGMIC]
MLHAFFVGVTLLFGFLSFHDAGAAAPQPWQMGFQEPVTEIMEAIQKSHNFVMVVMSAVVIVVFILLAYVLIKFRRRGDEPVEFNKRHSHNVLLEILWTIVPLLIVGFLTFSNVKLIKFEQKLPEADLVVKAIGYQWYWSYVYPEDGINFDSYMKPDSEIAGDELRLLEVDNRVVVPVGKTILLQSTSGDVIHSWAVPALGIKIDAVPGRLNEVWFSVKKPGVYYGQCSELCGRLHGFMPIVIEAVTQEQYDKWLASKKAGE